MTSIDAKIEDSKKPDNDAESCHVNSVPDSDDGGMTDASSRGKRVDERRLLRKIDVFVIPWLALLYLLNSLDRSNVGNARVSQ